MTGRAAFVEAERWSRTAAALLAATLLAASPASAQLAGDPTPRNVVETQATIARLLGIDSAWTLGYALGVFVILAFAREQLNRPLDVGSVAQRRARLVEMFAPDQLRSRAVFARGFAFYAGLLLLGYTLLSLGGASALQLLSPGGEASGALAEFDGASAPLFFALMLVGLMPSSPILSRIEKRMRELAHRMIGVPAHFHEFTDLLLQVRIEPDDMGDLRVGGAEAQRLRIVLGAMREALGDGPGVDRIEQAVLKLFAFQAWGRAAPEWPSWTVRNEFKRLELEIVPAVTALIEDLADLAERHGSRRPTREAKVEDAEQGAALPMTVRGAEGAPPVAVADGAILADGRALEARWRALGDRAVEAVEDVCALLALYAERADTTPGRDNAVANLLRELIFRAEAERGARAPQADILLRALLIMASLMFAIGAIGHASGVNPFPNTSAMGAGALWAMGILVNYGPSSFLTWSARQSAAARNAWRNAFDPDNVFPTLQYVFLFINAWFVSAISMATYLMFSRMWGHVSHVRSHGGELDFHQVFNDYVSLGDAGVAGQFWAALMFAVLGGFHACMMALIYDHVSNSAWRDRQERPPGDPRRGQVILAANAVGLAVLCFVAMDALGYREAAAGTDARVEMMERTVAQAVAAPIERVRALDTGENLSAEEALDRVKGALRTAWDGAPQAYFAVADNDGAAVARRQAVMQVGRAAAALGPDWIGPTAAAMQDIDPDLKDLDVLRARLARPAPEEAWGFSALDSILYSVLSAGLFGLSSAWLMLRALRRLYELRYRRPVPLA
ncbi:hypothetical protein [Rubrimonas cliftonensis]|uniref:Uncharacterized protein n=1 Tax=Rubrimonas cliftonensis TaxID=89524 RepID=A0A1H3YM00_9RHOB|nr:hypothetical protein [Rubrimonas cliftonensis]SEA12553.1 hypothetical protein SAMN05444370_103157 [Rubrimonas cliftonensis]